MQLLSDPQRAEKVSKLLSDFDAISVREEKTRNVVEELTGKKAKVLVDSTLLLDSHEWCKHVTEKPLQLGGMYFYTILIIFQMYIVKLKSSQL